MKRFLATANRAYNGGDEWGEWWNPDVLYTSDDGQVWESTEDDDESECGLVNETNRASYDDADQIDTIMADLYRQTVEHAHEMLLFAGAVRSYGMMRDHVLSVAGKTESDDYEPYPVEWFDETGRYEAEVCHAVETVFGREAALAQARVFFAAGLDFTSAGGRDEDMDAWRTDADIESLRQSRDMAAEIQRREAGRLAAESQRHYAIRYITADLGAVPADAETSGLMAAAMRFAAATGDRNNGRISREEYRAIRRDYRDRVSVAKK